MRWPNHAFSFILAVSIVNVQNAALYFLNKVPVTEPSAHSTEDNSPASPLVPTTHLLATGHRIEDGQQLLQNCLSVLILPWLIVVKHWNIGLHPIKVQPENAHLVAGIVHVLCM